MTTTPKTDTTRTKLGALPWIIWSLSALFYGYGYFQRVAPSVMVDDLMRDFAASAVVLGNLSAIYYYAYASLQIPVGILNDRFGPRRILTVAALVGGVGTVLFAMAPTLELAYAGRLLVGIGVAFAWVSTLKLASIWFPPHRFAMITGMTLMVGVLGGFFGQAPLSLVIAEFGWRECIAVSSVVSFVLAGAIWIVVRDYKGERKEADKPRFADVLRAAKSVMSTMQTWYVALFGMSMAVLALGFMALWGVPYLMEVYGLDRPSASLAISLGLIGQAVGAPFMGWFSDTLRRRKAPRIGGLLCTMGLFAWLVYGPTLPLALVHVVMFAMGFTNGASIIAFAAAKENAPTAAAGVTVACVNTFLMAGGALMQPVAGWILDVCWDGTLVEGVRVYGLDVWRTAFAPFVAFCGVGLTCTLLMRETHCRTLEERKTS